jgi:hypothetical protein
MKPNRNHKGLLLALLSAFSFPLSAFPQTTAFTYQGRLNDGGTPANGSYVFRFSLDDGNGVTVGSPIVTSPMDVSNGLFTVTLDFGPGIFTGANRRLDIEVHTNQQNLNFTALTPPQPILPTPFAIYAETTDASGLIGVVPAASLSGTYSNAMNVTNVSNTFAGNGAGLVGVNAAKLGGLAASNFWQTAGNAGTTAGPNFLGTTDNQPLELHVNGQRVLRLDSSGSVPNIIGGHAANSIAPGLSGVTIAGGGDAASFNSVNSSWGTVSGGSGNTIAASASAGTISGGANNLVANNAGLSTINGGFGNIVSATHGAIGGGEQNWIKPLANHSFIGGGAFNQVSGVDSVVVGGTNNQMSGDLGVIVGGGWNTNSGRDSFIGGGKYNAIGPYDRIASYSLSGDCSMNVIGGGYNNIIVNATGPILLTQNGGNTIAGGLGNNVGSNTFGATIAGGIFNRIAGLSTTIGGGYQNTIQTNGESATIGGGEGNTIQADGYFSTIGGGDGNTIQMDAKGSTIGGGDQNTIQIGAMFSTIGGGGWNTIESNAWMFATIPGGYDAVARSYGQQAYASGAFASAGGGSAQASVYVLRGVTTNASPTEIFLDGNASGSGSARMNLPASGLWAFDILIVAGRTDVKQDAGYQIKGIIGNVAGVTLLKGLNKTVLWEDDASWDVSVEADSTHQALVIKATGGSGQTIRWVANVRTVEVIR